MARAKYRATRRDIDEALMALNITAGLSHDVAASAPHDGQAWIIGSYYVMGAYGGWQLVQVMGDTGGVRSITQGYATAREILDAISAYRGGMAAGRLAVRG